MADGDLIVGKQSAGVVQTASNSTEVCSWVVPIDTTARVEVHCIVQQVSDNTAKSSYKLVATVRRDSVDDVSISSGPTIVNTEDNSAVMTVNLTATGSTISAVTANTDDEVYRVSCFMNIYTTSQFVNGYSLLFGGTDEYVTMGNVLDFESTDAFSISCWLKKSIEEAYLVAKFDSLSKGWAVLLYPTDTVTLILTNDNIGNLKIRVDASASSLLDGYWYSLVICYDGSGVGSGVSIYIDGVIVSTTIVFDTLGSLSIKNTGAFQLGARQGPNALYEGNLDEVSIYNKELSLAEVLELYNGGIPVNLLNFSSVSNLLGYWRCGDGDIYPTIQDHSSDYQFPTIPDETANSYDGTATNMEVSDIQFVSPGSQALIFDGTNEYVTMGNVLNFERTDSFSAGCWFKSTFSSNLPLFSKSDGTTTYRGWNASVRIAGSLYISLGNDSATNNGITVETINTSFGDDSWHYFMMTYDGLSSVSGLKIYVDNSLQAITTIRDNLTGTILNTSSFNIACRTDDPTKALGCSISDVSVWNKELSVTEVSEIYNNKVPINLTTVSCASDLAAWWRCGERFSLATDGVPDFSGNGLHGTQQNMEITDVEDRTYIGSSMVFGGTDEYITMGNVLDSVFDYDVPFSVSCWFKVTSGNGGYFISKLTGSIGWGFFLDSSDGKIRFIFIEQTGAPESWQGGTNTVGFNDGKWHHIIFTFDGSSTRFGISIYVDNIDQTIIFTDTNLSNSVTNSASFNIGGRTDGSVVFAGSIDDVSIWDKELSLLEIEAIYNAGIPTDLTGSTNLVGYWKMGEGVGFNGTMTNMEAGDIVVDTPD